MKVTERHQHGCYYRTWHAENPKGAIQLVHGLAEHCQRYEHLAQTVTQAGYSLYAMDLPNHGKSDGKRGHLHSFAEFEAACQHLYESMQGELPNAKKFLLGHSMGGLIASCFLLNHQHQYNGAMLSGPAIQSPQEPPAWQVHLITLISKLFPKAGMLTLESSGISRDKAVYERYMNDPLVFKSKLSAKFLVELNAAMARITQHAADINVPLLIMHGSSDNITAPAGSQYLYDNCQSDDKTLKLYEGLYHEIFNEPEHPGVFKDLIEWLDKRV